MPGDVTSAMGTASSVVGAARSLAQARDLSSALGAVSSVAGAAGALSSVAQSAGAVSSVAQTVGTVAQTISTVAQSVQAFETLAEALASSLQGTQPLPEVRFAFDCEPGWRVTRFDAREALCEPFECRIDLAAEELSANPDDMLGQPGALTLSRDTHQRFFHGVVRRVEHLGVAHGHRVARVFLVPALWALSQRVDVRIFQNRTTLDIVRDVLRGASLYADALDTDRVVGTMLTREYCVQYQESDLDFIRRLLEDEGITWWIRHDEHKETLVLSNRDDGWADLVTFDGNPVPVAGPEVATHHTEAVRHLDWGAELRPTSTTVRDFDFTRPDFDLTQQSPRDNAGARAVYAYARDALLDTYQQPTYGRDNAAARAQMRQLAEQARARRGIGDGVVTAMEPGKVFTLQGHGHDDLNGRHLLLRVEHEGHVPEELTDGTQHGPDTPRYRARFECQPARVPLRPWRTTARPVVHGMQTATVVGPPDEEIYTDEHGRIKVQFHWDRIGARNENSSCWVRVLQPWAGPGWGFVFIPRVGMEVVVHFLEGDPDRPVVIGSLYNGANRPPYELPAEKTKSTLKTNSSPGGNGFNELRFEDAAGSEEIFLHAQKDMNEVVEHDHTTTVHHDQTNTVDHNHTESVGGDQSLSVSGNRTKTITHDETTTVHGKRTETVDHEEDLTIKGTRTERVTGKETITLRNARETEVQSGDKLTVHTANRDVIVETGDDTLDVKTGSARHHAKTNYHVTGDAEVALTQGVQTLTMNANGVVMGAVGNQVRLVNASGFIEIKDQKIKLSANTELSLVCGAASITLKNDGTITVSGAKKVDVQASGAGVTCEPSKVTVHGPQVASQATGTNEVSGAMVKIN